MASSRLDSEDKLGNCSQYSVLKTRNPAEAVIGSGGVD